MMKKTVSVVTVNFNQPQVTEELLQSISIASLPLQVIVVDNGSKTDHTAAWRTKYPHVEFIRSEKNLGFAGGNNLGIKKATGDYIFHHFNQFFNQPCCKFSIVINQKKVIAGSFFYTKVIPPGKA